MSLKIQGMITAIVTPFKDGKVDENAFARLIERQINAGISGLVICGSTGETATLRDDEFFHVIKFATEITKKRVPIIANVGSNNTAKAIELVHKACELDIDAILSVVPYFNKPSQHGIYLHFKAIHDATTLPIVLYNVPGRTVADMNSDTVLKLCELPRIISIKDATANMDRPLQVQSKLKRSDFTMVSGDDSSFLSFNANGGSGCISVAANIMPEQMIAIQKLCELGDFRQALALHLKLMPLYNVLFCEANPIPTKYALGLMGLCQDEVRLPLCQLSSENKEKVRTALVALELL